MSPTSPRQIQIDPNLPSGHPRVTPKSPNAMSPSRAIGPDRHRGMSLDGQRALERQIQQAQQDLDSAISMSRARSGSMGMQDAGPPVRPSAQHYPSSSPIGEDFPILSDAEEADLDRARSGFRGDGEDELDEGHRDHRIEDEEERGEGMMDAEPRSMGSSGYDSHAHLLPDHDYDRYQHEDQHRYGRAPPGVVPMPVKIDFALMDQYAKDTAAQVESHDATFGFALPSSQTFGDQPGFGTPMERTATTSAFGDDHDPAFSLNGGEPVQQPFQRRRHRKLSQSNPVLRRGAKLAMFEGFGNGNGALGSDSTPFKNSRQGKMRRVESNLREADGFIPYTDNQRGHDSPYRFSFYSSAMNVTIHARSMADLPDEGQNFEDLFKGRGGETANRSGHGTDGASVRTSARPGTDTPTDPSLVTSAKQGIPTRPTIPASVADRVKAGAPPPPPAEGQEYDPENHTWWLDVLSPTDDEMRMLSKAFGIHPLTTEDILLEETREKIELFRTYYLVCFRSFDQDPYSQTYLEPLNMYIIVFREGTLSFHFRGTPHPQNVRRRIKQLDDFVLATSDWISYALIDDITDAFGPLIQSIEYEVDSIDELVLILKDAEQSDMLRRIGTCRKKVMGLLRLMGNKADVVKGLAKRCTEQWVIAPKSDIGLYLSDIQDHLITMTQNLNHYEKILSRSHSNYLAQISIEMTDANNQINDVLSKLTALGTVLIPMNLVTGLWGMNVHVPGQDIESGYAWFGGILGCLCAFAILGAFATYKCFVR
ncbi:magnesium transporter [Tremella mesenterica]|uniref:Magnesium transporter n=1 Tax=Tremella mesenterica TaxID=5217 RepID=A0A4Q1BBF4_TREME|nr:magnesium transporter [Tremella mesenterica]